MRWIRTGWRPLAVALGLVLLVVAVGNAAPVVRPGDNTVLHHLVKRWAPENLGRDACDVIPQSRVGRLLDTDVRLTERMLSPAADGWQVRCGYGDGRLGLATATVTLTTGVAPDQWEPYQRSSEHEPIRLQDSATIGDETYVAFEDGPDGTTAVRMEARNETSVVRLEYFAPVGKSGGVPNPLPALELTSVALKRISGSTYAPAALPTKAYGGCQHVDRSVAADVLGEKLRTTRTTDERGYGRNSDLHCSYAGEKADLQVTVWHGMDAEAYLEPLRPELRGIGDAAAFDATVFPDGQARLSATIQVGNRIISVDGGYADKQNVDRRKPTDAERALLKSIVRDLA